MVCVCAFTTPHSITFISATNLTLDAFATNPVNLAFRQRNIKKGVATIVLLNFGSEEYGSTGCGVFKRGVQN